MSSGLLKLYRLTAARPAGLEHGDVRRALVYAASEDDARMVLQEYALADLAWPYDVTEVSLARSLLITDVA